MVNISVTISEIKSPSNFTVTPTDFDAFQQQLFTYAESNKIAPILRTNEEVLVKSDKTNAWMRGYFIGCDGDKGESYIKLIDFNRMTSFPTSNLRAIPAHFSLNQVKPKLSRICHLEGSLSRQWTDTEITHFKELVHTKKLSVDILNYPTSNIESHEVRLYINGNHDVSFLLNKKASVLVAGPHRVLNIISPIEIYVLPEPNMQSLKRINYALDLTSVMKFPQIPPEHLCNFPSNDIMVAVYCSESDAWYRGYVTKVFNDTQPPQVEVFCIDYGHCKQVNLGHMTLRQCPTTLAAWPPVAEVCAYDSADQKSLTQWTESDIEALKVSTAYQFHLEPTRSGDSISLGRPYARFYSLKDKDKEIFRFPEACLPIRQIYCDDSESYICYVNASQEGTSFMYINVGCDTLLSEFNDNILNEYNLKQSPKLHRVFANDMCVVHYEDCWYRARVLKAEENNNLVSLVDIGEEIRVPQLFSIHADLLQFNALSIKCRIGSQNHPIAEEIIKELCRLSSENVAVRVRFVTKKEPVEVRLFQGEKELLPTLTSSQFITLPKFTHRTNWPTPESGPTLATMVYRPTAPVNRSSDIEKKIYVTLASEAATVLRLEQLLGSLVQLDLVPAGTDIHPKDACLVDFRAKGGRLERVQIVSEEQFNRIYVFLVDRGEVKNIPREALLCIPTSAKDLLNIPPLALQLDYADSDILRFTFLANTPVVFQVSKPVTNNVLTVVGVGGQVAPRTSERFTQVVFAQCVFQHQDHVVLQMIYQQKNFSEVHAALNDNVPLHNMSSIVIGLDCAVLCDGAYKRARIIAVNGQSVTVRWLDYGQNANVSVSDIKSLPSGLYATAPLAISCRLVSSPLIKLPSDPTNYKIVGGDRSSCWLIECC